MRTALYGVAIVTGVALALLGSEPLWILAVVALLAFPIAAAFADRRASSDRRGQGVPLAPATITALAGGLLATLAVRLATQAPGWLSETAADCGAASTSTQQLVLWSAALIFLAAAVPVAVTLLSIGTRLNPAGRQLMSPPPLNLYPVAVAASGLALVAAGYVTTC